MNKMECKFYFNNGETAEDIPGLVRVLKGIDEATFKYHLNKDKNDFLNWIKTGLGRTDIADDIKKVKTRKGLIKRLKSYT